MTNPSSSHQALLEIIEEKERELVRIRHAANTAAEEEKKTTQQKLTELKSDHEHNIRLLFDKDETIKSLREKIHSMEIEHVQSTRAVEDRCKEMMNRHLDQMEHRLKEEARQHSELFEQQQRKKLQGEFEEKLSQRERNLQVEYQRLLADELRDQEDRIHRKFEKIMTERESEQKDVERDLRSRLAEQEREAASTCREFEQQWRNQEQSIVRELEMKHEAKMTMEIETLKNEHKRYMSDQEHEIENVLRDMRRLGKEKLQFEEESKAAERKVSELLNVVQYMEKGYAEKTFEYEQEKRGLQARLMEASEQMSVMEMETRRREVGYHQEINRQKRQNKEDKKAAKMKMKELKRELLSANDDREEKEQSLVEKTDEAERSKKRLKDKITSLTQECICLRGEISILNERVADGEQNEYVRKEEQDRLVLERKNADATARKKIYEQFERTMQKDREIFAREKLQLTKDRDNAMLDKESSDAELEHWREEVSRLKGQLSLVTDQHRGDVDALHKENSCLKAKYKEERQGNLQLKNTLADMRKEMEELMATCSSAAAAASCRHENRHLPCAASRDELCNRSELNSVLGDLRAFTRDMVKAKSNLNEDKRILVDEEAAIVNKVQNLQENLKHLSSEYDAVTTERDRLLEMSNKLRSELSRLRNIQGKEGSIQVYRDKGESHLLNQTIEEIDVDDLARSVWNKAILKPAASDRELKTRVKSSDRATDSQKQCLQKMRINHSENRSGRKSKGITKIRNWNMKTDN